MEQRSNFLALILLDALEDENESDICNILRRNDVDASYVPCERGISPLHYTCGMPNEQLSTIISMKFLESGANPNVRCDGNMTPLHIAAIYGRVEIVKLLLQFGAEANVMDDEGKMPVHYAIEEDHFEVVQVMRDHIYLQKCKKIKQKSRGKESNGRTIIKNNATPNQLYVQKKLPATVPLCENNAGDVTDRLQLTSQPVVYTNTRIGLSSTPQRLTYNFDATSPYYINITHRRNKPQPQFPICLPLDIAEYKKTPVKEPECTTTTTEIQSVNLFALTKENLQDLKRTAHSPESSHISLIETWREKVQRSHARQKILKQYDNIAELVDNIMDNEHLNFTNTELKDHTIQYYDADRDSDAGSLTNSITADCLPEIRLTGPTKPLSSSHHHKVMKDETRVQSNCSLDKIIRQVSEARHVDMTNTNRNLLSPVMRDTESSYHTVPDSDKQLPLVANQHRSLNSCEYFLQMTEAYVHTDDENGLVFYETKLLNHLGKKPLTQHQQRKEQARAGTEMDTTGTSTSTATTVPLDYETDALRAELTTFGEIPGPITKSTKRLYIKRLIKYKRKPAQMLELRKKQFINESKFSVELQRTLRSVESFEAVNEYFKYETNSAAYFANYNRKEKNLREGNLKLSFIYMLIDPRLSCNLPSDSHFVDKLEVWNRFLDSIFYVGKGKSTRPYSHLYEAMKTHTRTQQNDVNENKTSSNNNMKLNKKQSINFEAFKSPPTRPVENKKLERILDIWSDGLGVVCLHVFHNIVPTDAYTREAAIIDAIGLRHLTNMKRGDYYGTAQSWTMKEKKYFGIALLYKAMQIYLAEGESQLSPSDLI